MSSRQFHYEIVPGGIQLQMVSEQKGLLWEVTPAGRGQIVSHRLFLPSEQSEMKIPAAPEPLATPRPESPPPTVAATPSLEMRLAQLEQRVADLERRLGAEG